MGTGGGFVRLKGRVVRAALGTPACFSGVPLKEQSDTFVGTCVLLL